MPVILSGIGLAVVQDCDSRRIENIRSFSNRKDFHDFETDLPTRHAGSSRVRDAAFADDVTLSTLGLSGYDPVVYFTDGKTVRRSGFHVTVRNGVTYALAVDDHKTLFAKSPEKYLPAYGVAVGKKFVADPEMWAIVGDNLYLNLDKGIQQKWQQDIPCYIVKAEKSWPEIAEKNAADL